MAGTIILGAGVTGLSAGFKHNRLVYEKANWAGGICTSYYVDGSNKAHSSRESKDDFHFEFGGGHWIFGSDPRILRFLKSMSPIKNYQRKASVYFPEFDLYVPYPLQNNLHCLPLRLRRRIEQDMKAASFDGPIATLEEWLLAGFGKTLCDLFFFPFHDLYTAGLYKEIAPQDGFKSPIRRDFILKGLKEKTSSVGYNTTFAYPTRGLDHLIKQMKKHCNVCYNKNTLNIDLNKKRILFQDGTETSYQRLISTIPLNEMIRVCNVKNLRKSDPCTSVVVFNIGAKKGRRCPQDHWVYIPKTKSGFHRVGFYSNVDHSFLPAADKDNELVSIYVEKAFLGGEKPAESDLAKLGKAIIEELKEWQYIKDVQVLSPTWIDTAYTWQFPKSTWKQEALEYFEKHGVKQAGRYGTWKFQGILESIKDGLSI